MNDPEILYEDTDCIVLAKPAGMLVHGIRRTHTNTHPQAGEETIASWVLRKYPQVRSVGDDSVMRPGIVHRLDRDTSGVLLIALTQSFFTYAKKLFQAHEVTKEYRALVWGYVKKQQGTIALPIGLRQGTTKRTTVTTSARMVKDAVTEYHVRKRFVFQGEPLTLLSVFPKTGRTHQIRVHLTALGHPLVHDTLYGGKTRLLKSEAMGSTRQFLHAYSIALTLPSSLALKVASPLPQDLEQVLARLTPSQEEHRQYS